MKKIPDPNKMKKVKGPVISKKDLSHVKVRITTYLDLDILEHLKKMAKEMGSKYQSILNQTLRSALFHQQRGIFARLNNLEKSILKKRD